MAERTPFWLWLNLLSLDAPLVALVWQDFLSRCYPYLQRPAGRWALGLTVWAIYLADRLMDVRHPAVAEEAPRHEFYRRHRRAAGILLAAVAVADLLVAMLWLRPAVLSDGVRVGTAVAVYLAIFALRPQGAKRWKQPVAALLFVTGVFLVAWTRIPDPWHVLAGPAAAFCGLCLGNLLLLETWEQGRTTARGWAWMVVLAAVCLLAERNRWYGAAATSAAALAILDFRSRGVSANARHVLADAVLLTPLLFR